MPLGYQIDRRELPAGAWGQAGIVPRETFLAVYRDTELCPPDDPWCEDAIVILGITTPLRWFFAWEYDFPVAGVLYEYRVRAYDLSGPGGWSPTVQYRAAPYWCWADGEQAPC